ncbi:uncharacterized protein L3040_006805 [Drepanopeziza brunnea f. sp. 'multigermtubi']|uniref:uncharacterized protein n=1 Tax=Drepanopeziza brunnea f. sp. 'multigermtubi' TaxID=698441 RepID=UPI0023A2BE72|nr:hypothetical protein L3040_006805 [Drepanopeziza brunnea f. sp. 'multigermtubi']
MVRITKTMQTKHSESLSPYVKEFRDSACAAPLEFLPQHLATFPTTWPFPRGDLYHWIPLLNRFDDILAMFCAAYKLVEPQTEDFGCSLLENSLKEAPIGLNFGQYLAQFGYSSEGDRELVESVLRFSTLLMRNCGNRTIYASSSHLNHVLNTTSLSLIQVTLELASELAQRYSAALKRTNIPIRNVANSLLTSHYNINLEKVLQLAQPFSKTVTSPAEPAQPATPATPSVKGKEKAIFSVPSPQKVASAKVYANDFASMVKGGSGVSGSPKSVKSGLDPKSRVDSSWEEWGDVMIKFETRAEPDMNGIVNPPTPHSPAVPATPTPSRRSNLGPHVQQRTDRQSGSADSPATLPRTSTFPATASGDPARDPYKYIEIAGSKIRSDGMHMVLAENMSELKPDQRYELLHKLRVANALSTSLETRRQILAIRLLAITNLIYVQSEQSFLANDFMKQDQQEPRRSQLISQLAELVHPPAEGEVAVPRPIQTLALGALDALAGITDQFKNAEVCAALNTNVNHGVLLYVVRTAVAELNTEDKGAQRDDDDGWRYAIFSLLSNLCTSQHTAGNLVTAGLIPILLEVITLRTSTAERYQPMVLTFLDSLMYSTREAFQNLVSADGLDAVSDLMVHEVAVAARTASSGAGIPLKYRAASVDYEVAFFQQQVLKWVLKFVHHMMATPGGYGGNFDRLLRNLIDSSTLLASLRQIIGNARVYGSVVWTNAVSILNDFINNEPTSFAVIAEAGLSRGLLEAVTGTTIVMPPELTKPSEPAGEESAVSSDSAAESAATDTPSPASDDEGARRDDYEGYQVLPVTQPMLEAPRANSLARGIMPTSETINIVPQAFSAICLNNAGMKMFKASKALEIFFEIFESPEHVKCMDTNKELPSSLGGSFDELMRHHPPLKDAIMTSIVNMVARVDHLCKTKAANNKVGAKLWTTDQSGKPVIANDQITHALVDRFGKGKAADNSGDVEMEDAESTPTQGVASGPVDIASTVSMTPYITAVATFLSAMFSNTSVRSDFCNKGGLPYVLSMAHSDCLSYDFAESTGGRTFNQVISLIAETKPHLVMPSLIQSALKAAEDLQPFISNTGSSSFFAPFVDSEARQSADVQLLARGTKFVKALVFLHSSIPTMVATFQPSPYNHRNTNNVFSQVNVSDYYVRLVNILGPLLGASLREEMRLQKSVPDYWKHVSRTKESGFGESPANASREGETSTSTSEEPVGGESADTTNTSSVAIREPSTSVDLAAAKPKTVSKAEQSSPCFKNYQTLKYLLGKMPKVIKPFFQTLGKALVSKRATDSFLKQGHLSIAEALAESMIGQLAAVDDECSSETYSYWSGIIAVLNDMLVESSRHNERPVQTITIVLQAFKDQNGIKALNHILGEFTHCIRSYKIPEGQTAQILKAVPLGPEETKVTLATQGTERILGLYSQIVNGRNLTEAIQTMSMLPRERGQALRVDQFSPSQLLVELRMAVLPFVRSLWVSDLLETGLSDIAGKLIDIIRTIALADCESNALKRSDKPVFPAKPAHKTLKITPEHMVILLGYPGVDKEFAEEALYRCNNNISFAMDYCKLYALDAFQRNPVPEGDLPPSIPASNLSSSAQTSTSTGASTPVDHHMAGSIEDTDHGLNQAAVPGLAASVAATPPNLEALFTQNRSSVAEAPAEVQKGESAIKRVTVDDLNEERALIRDDLIDKCLDVLSAHNTLTFEISDLISAVVNKSEDPTAQRKVVSETLVVALMSFAGEEDWDTNGEKVAAFANLLALMLRDKLFFAAALDELKENLDNLLGFIKLAPRHSAEWKSPWVSQILLIVEMLLSEDARPQKTKWTLPKDDNDKPDPPVLELAEPVFSPAQRAQLLDSILGILNHIGKDEGLALAVLRILVILTRSRPMAQYLGETKNIQGLFLLAKQLCGASSARIQSPLLIVLRHIIEDDETIKQIMRSEIKSFMEANRQARALDEKAYLRGLAHTAVRSPKLFVEVTNEMVKFNRWTYQVHESRSTQSLVLKEVAPASPSKIADESVHPTVQATEDLSIQDVKASTEAGDIEMADLPKTNANEQKLPVVENPDGVIHFLLKELMAGRILHEKDSDSVPGQIFADKSAQAIHGDLPMTNPSPTEGVHAADAKADSKSTPKLDFKPEDHPHYIYRCFLLQCLTELLSSYNRTKIEFINFKRSAPPQAMTPSKPRSTVLSYLLSDLIPIGTLKHVEGTALRKKLVTSNWADSVITALVCKTGELPVDKTRDAYDSDNEPDLLFVRKFVLENILKAYKEASASSEPLDSKYAKLLSLAELMNHIMTGKENLGIQDTSVANASQKQLRRIMFEKGYVAALTASIADIDLNFQDAKRAVKYILKPLKTLTATAISLSDLALITSTPGQADEDEIESATSLSDEEESREETPDLFRNSSLGMLEPGREDDSSSDSDDEDEEMYEDGYDDEMDYDDGAPGAEEDGVSDEDEEIEGMGPIEGLDGDHGVDVEVIMEDDDEDDDEMDSSGADDDDEDEDDDHDSEDDDGRVEIIDEVGNIQQLAADEEIGEWVSDDGGEEEVDDEGEEEDYDDEIAGQEDGMHAIDMPGGPIGHLVRALAGDAEAAEIIGRMEADGIDAGEEDEEEQMQGEYAEDDEEDEDEDEMNEAELFFDQHQDRGFPWPEDVEPPVVLHRRPRGGFSPFPLPFAGGPRDPLGGTLLQLAQLTQQMEAAQDHLDQLQLSISLHSGGRNRTDPNAVPDYRGSYRSHRPGAPAARAGDDGINPLLQRSGPGAQIRDLSSRPAGGWLQAFAGHSGEILDIGGRPFGESPATEALLDEVIRSLPITPGQLARNGHALQFHITAPPGQPLPPDFQAMFGMRPQRWESSRSTVVEPGSATFFAPQSTSARWLEEAKIIFGSPTAFIERANELATAILALLVPPAIEIDRAAKAAAAEKARKEEEEKQKRVEEERIARAQKEEEERVVRERKELEEREEAERVAAEALAARGPEPESSEPQGDLETPDLDRMDGIESEAPEPAEQAAEADAAPAANQPRITTMIRGNPYDITDLGIDPSFLEELPDELREEVIMSAVAERRSAAAATGGQPSDIDQEFLDALPDDIRDEIMQQERADRRRREREQRNRAAAEANGGAGPAAVVDADTAAMLANLAPALRNQMLAEQDEATIALLPQDLQVQARAVAAAQGGHRMPPRLPVGYARRGVPNSFGELRQAAERPQRRATVQMLDKPGIATLLRLMFLSLQGSLRTTFYTLLQNISMNRHNRNEIISTILHVLQEGSVDISAVERSFSHLSLRAKQPKETQPKTPQTPSLKRTLTNLGPVAQITFDVSPLMVAAQCLDALVTLSQTNPHVPAYFLTEHNVPAEGLKRTFSRKGKGKDNKAAKYALNSLLSLLDRDLIMESSKVMEHLSTLLNTITSPLQGLQRKQKEAEEAKRKAEADAAKAAETVALAGTTTTTSDQPEEPKAEASGAEATVTEVPCQESAPEGGETSVDAQDPKSEPAKELEKQKKIAFFNPPVIPDHNLKLVINIFVARECSSKTFRETLSTIKNLSTIPDAKAVFGRELISKAQGLGSIILIDLEELLPQIEKATTGTEIQGVALAKFSPGGSDQNKLLRVLTALDHLFDPKREKKDKPTEAEAQGESFQLVEKQDLLSSLYENSTFGRMWERLSACLSAIRQREQMLNVATILLPLIEALMVVCKNTTLKDTPISRTQHGKEMLLTSPPPDSQMESLFYTFTEEHRKILNDLVRNTPKLMSGTFSLLVKNPKVLEFDNKRNYFTRSVHAKAPNSRQSFPPLQLSVRRDQVFHDSFKSLYFQTGDQMKFGKLSIRFHGEEGVDAGGVTREWFQVLSRQMFDPGYALFVPVSSDRTTFHPNHSSSINEEHLMFFKFIGRIIGKALYEGRVLDCHFSRAVYKRILGKAVSVKDMESLDLDYYKSLVWMLENDITDIITETFSTEQDKFGVTETIDFIPNGRNIPVTEENKHEYVRLMTEWRLTGSVKEQLDEFLKGFHDIIPAELVAIFNEQELELLISGLPEIDVDDWKSNTEYHNYTASSPQIQWFWRAIRSFDKEERAKLLQFVTGTSKVPLNGFKELEGMNGFSRFNIHRDYGSKDRLPSSHTCFNQLDLPEYESYESLRNQVLTAITAGSEYFGFA